MAPLTKREIAVYLVAIVIGLSVVLWTWVLHPAPGNPLRFPVPQMILGPKVVAPGATIIVEGFKCNETDDPVTTTGESHWKRIDLGGPGSTEFFAEGRRTHDPGCTGHRFENIVPQTEGIWRLEGIECLIERPDVCRSWYVENVEVRVP